MNENHQKTVSAHNPSAALVYYLILILLLPVFLLGYVIWIGTMFTRRKSSASATAQAPLFARWLAQFRRITEQFPGGQIAFDGYSGSMVRLVSRLATVRGAKVKLVWGVDDPHDLEKQIPALHLAESVEFLMMPELLSRLSTNRFRGAMYRVMGKLPFYRRLVRHLRYEFSGKPRASIAS